MIVLHIITSLSSGGAERTLSKLVNKSEDKNIKHIIITLFNLPKSYYIDKDVQLISLNYKNSFFNKIKVIFAICRYTKIFQPDIIQFWMKTNIYSIFIYLFFKNVKIISNYRNSYYSEGKISKFLTKFSSKYSDGNIFVSDESLTERVKNHFCLKNPIVIGNGFQLNEMHVNDKKVITFGYIGRYHPVKNQQMLIDAINNIEISNLPINFVFAGRGLTPEKFNIETNYNIEWLEEIKDVSNFYKNIDILILTSKHEGFPNVIGEAMSYGKPVITTNAGASWKIIGDSGYKIESSTDLKNIICRIAIEDRHELKIKSHKAHDIIKYLYSDKKMILDYEKYYYFIKGEKK
ncbi:glycosyltransferase [Macrococcoides caseolyticum]|uniref:glycosyltransferase n=1 Tax=Macrococcoides caseolyticum TaxID=69966 RepID=UPI0024BC205C|nr:glycosyltransferase [Macrococcus caseolyticus]MDJ1088759.1 glycosyltransferase [Macrococcus caseolyticus]